MPGFIVRVRATMNRAAGEDGDRQFNAKARFDTVALAKAWIDDRFTEARQRARIGGIDIHLRVVADADYTDDFKSRFDAEN